MFTKFIRYGLACFLCILLYGCPNPKHKKMNHQNVYTNDLINETSPYLLQHAHNPVNWMAYNKKSLSKATSENKLMIISIGYAACHWCHVMEHESFEDTAVANIMNKYFVNIKVDREERPDVDNIYMDACNAMTGKGGWPLNIIALPDGRPIYAGTYFPKEKWIYVLEKLQDSFITNKNDLVAYADSVTAYIQSPRIKIDTVSNNDSLDAFFEAYISTWQSSMDFKNGGTKGGNKFPMPCNFDFLLYYQNSFVDENMFNYVKLSLDKMCNGGINDQLDGGFARYSVDERWLVPHFEKMLYDNAQLVSLYANAYRLSGNNRYKEVVEQTLLFLQNELQSKERVYYASLDADSDGEEGKYYTWTYTEMENLLGNNASLINEFYGVSHPGNWERGKNVLYRPLSVKQFSSSNGISIEECTKLLKEANALLLAERNTRTKPALDDKILVSWNALMIKAYCDAYKATHNEKYLTAAKNIASFILLKCMTKEYRLNRNYKNGLSNINAFLEDYALCISAFIDLYENTFEQRYINTAKGLNEYAFSHFYDNKTGFYFYTSNTDRGLIARKIELEDNVIPSSNAVMAENLVKLGHVYAQTKYINNAKHMIDSMNNRMIRYPNYHAQWAKVKLMLESDYFELAIVGPNALKLKKELNSYYLPNVFIVGSVTESKLPILSHRYTKNKTQLFVCQNQSCKAPVSTIREVLQQIQYNYPEYAKFIE